MKKKIIIIGAGEAGKMVSNDILNNKKINEKYDIIGFLDDDIHKDVVNHIPIIGRVEDIGIILPKYAIDEIIIAIPSASKELISSIIRKIPYSEIPVKIIPGIYDIIQGEANWKQLRDVKPEDLLGREEVGIELDKIAEYYKDKIVFITGAGGSIGSEIVRNILKLPVKNCIGFGHGENSIHNLIEEFRFDNRFGFVIGDIRDIDKLNYELSIYKPDIVFHAAAHKHLPLMEDYPDESVKNNIIGTHNVLTASIKNGVKRFLLISTDKAVNPTSVMGATKRIAEFVVLSHNNFQSVTRTSIVRFGNVLGSRGSVIPTFKKHIESGGPINLTDPNIERFFMSIPEAAKLVIKSICITPQNDKSNIFILDMGRPIKIMELAKNLIKLSGHNEDEIQIRVVGLRKGEKLFEELSYDKEKLFTTQFDKILSTSEANIELTQEQLTLMLDEFTNAAKVFNTNEIKRLLKKYIPQYKF